jgi:FtsP/CotA-like multicopper oxidase with cupredoxin domain
MLGLMGGAAAGVLLAACTDDEDEPAVTGTTGSTRTPSAGETATAGPGSSGAWFEPAVLRSKDGVLDVTLRLSGGTIPYGNGTRWALLVNGTTPGPTLRVRPGDRLRIRLENATERATNLHTHGLHVSPSGNADNPFLEIAAGQSFQYEIDIPADHPGGLHWYHPHLHHHVAQQLFAGFFGAIVVEDAFDAMPEVAAAQERLILLHDTQGGATEAAVTGTSMMDQMMGREGSVVLVNGVRVPAIETASGELERWRIVNASPSRFYRLQLEGHTFQVIGTDTGRLGGAVAVPALNLVPGERVEVLVQPTAPGTYRLSTSSVDRGAMGMGMGRGGGVTSAAANLLSMVVTGQSATAASLPALPPASRIPEGTPSATREVVFAMQGMAFYIDGKQFDANRIDITASLGTTEEWTIRNTSTMDHPFHIHVWPFEVVAMSSGTPEPGLKDVVNVPAGGWVRIRIRFADIPGKTVFHCHILDHEDMGMMGVIQVA